MGKSKRNEKSKARKFGVSSAPGQVESHLHKLGLKIKDMRGDGNCLFRALCDQYEGSPSNHSIYRAKVCDYMEEHPQDFAPFIPDDSLEHHLKLMRQDGTYGGNLELVAFSKIFHVLICIYQDDGLILTIDASEGDTGKKRTIHIAYHSFEHYSSVRPVDGPNDGVFEMEKPSQNSVAELQDDSEELPEWKLKHIVTSTGVSDAQTIQQTLKDAHYDIDQTIEKLITLSVKDKEEELPVSKEPKPEPEVDKEPEIEKKTERRLTSREQKARKKKERKAKKMNRSGESKTEKDIEVEKATIKVPSTGLKVLSI